MHPKAIEADPVQPAVGRRGVKERREAKDLVGIVKPELFANEPAEVFRLAPFFHAAAADGRLHGVRLDGLWVHVGRPESIAQAEMAIDRSIL